METDNGEAANFMACHAPCLISPPCFLARLKAKCQVFPPCGRCWSVCGLLFDIFMRYLQSLTPKICPTQFSLDLWHWTLRLPLWPRSMSWLLDFVESSGKKYRRKYQTLEGNLLNTYLCKKKKLKIHFGHPF